MSKELKTDPYMKGFMNCLRSEKQGVFIRHLFVDLNDGNWSDAALFSQVCYIFAQLNDDGYRHYSIHERHKQSWISLSYAQWWHVCRLNRNTVRSVIGRVQSRGLIVTEKINTDGLNRLLIRIDYEQFSKNLQTIETVIPCDRIDHTTPIESVIPCDRIDHTTPIDSITPPDRIDHMTIYKDPEDPDQDPIRHLRNPERVCEEMEQSPEPERSVIVASEPESPPVFSGPIGGDTFPAAAPQKTSIEGFPIGPWGPSLFEIDAGFVGWMIAQWRKGDGRQSQAFGKMACEEVRACLQKYWKKDWSTLSIDWDAYSSNTQRLVEAVSDRMGRGIEISTQEQKLLNDRVKGPEHLRAQVPHSAPQQAPIDPVRVEIGLPSGAVPLIAASELSESQIEEIKRSSEAARSNLVAPDQGLFVGRLPIAAFMLWLEAEAQKHIIPGMSLRSIALGLGRRLEMQEAYLESVAQDF